MLEICKVRESKKIPYFQQKTDIKEPTKKRDLIITKRIKKEEIKNGKQITYYEREKVNLTKKLSETKSLLKTENNKTIQSTLKSILGE